VDYGAHGFARVQIIISVLLCRDEFLIQVAALLCRGGPKNCPLAIADFVLLHNKAAEALAKENRVGFDFYNGIADLKALSHLGTLKCNSLILTRICTWSFIAISARLNTHRNQKLHCKTSRPCSFWK
jgi:hypothetical protein